MAGYFVALLATCLLQGVLSVSVSVQKELIVKEGDPVEFLCHANAPILFCRIVIPNEGSYVVSPEVRVEGMNYLGEGLRKGDCGIKLFSAKEKHNGEFKCGITTADSAMEVEGRMNLTIAKTPKKPELKVNSPETGDSFKEGETLFATCTVRNGRPAANITWYIGDERITDGLKTPLMLDYQELFNIEQNLTRRVQASDNGKLLKCVAVHPLLNEKLNTSSKMIYVKFPPKGSSQPLERFGLVEGEEGKIHVSVQANPKPTFTWVVDGQQLHEGDTDQSGRLQVTLSKATPDMAPGSWDSVLVINPLTKEDVDRTYELVASNALGQQTYKVVISTNPEPKMLELGVGAIIGIVVAVLLLLTVASLILFARAKGRWCFAGQSSHFAGESSDTESADHQNPKIKKTPFTSVFKKKSDKVSSEEPLPPREAPEEEKEDENTEAGKVMLNPRNPDEAVVYAELDLNLAPGARPPIVRPEEDKTEYAEIIHSKETK